MRRSTHSLMLSRYQQGVALITALVIMAIAVSIAATLAYRQQVSIRLAGNLGALEQAYQYATGMETWAGIILTEHRKDKNTDSLTDDWAMRIPPITIPGGYMNGQILDLQGRINLNAALEAIKKNGKNTQKPSKVQIDRLKILFAKMKVPTKERVDTLTDSLLDWLDEDQQEKSRGAESGYYKTLEESYLAANSSLVSVSELRLVKGYNETIKDDKGNEESILEKITPFVNVLPTKTIKINVNTASAEVLYSLGLDQAQVDGVITDREVTPYPTVARFTSELGIQNQNQSQNQGSVFTKKYLSVDSHYFLLQGVVEIGKVRVFINSTLHRDSSGRTRVIHREFNEN